MKSINIKLLKHNKKTITIDELTKLFEDIDSYEEFYREVIKLKNACILEEVKSSGNNGFTLSLANKYRINKLLLQEGKTNIINDKILNTKSLISLESYFAKPLEIFRKDEPIINMINEYIGENGLPKPMLAPELSFELTGDEKWIEKGEGINILKRIGLWNKLVILKESDPSAFAINKKLVNKPVQKHLIVENKTPFLHLMDVIENGGYNTVIYGQGWKITAAIDIFLRQYPFGNEHEFYYFGDIDKEGISIFTNLKERYGIEPAIEFYSALYNKTWSKGKTNQRCSEETIALFIKYLIEKGQKEYKLKGQPDYILKMLKEGFYQPQELLTKLQLEALMGQGVRND